MKSKLEKVLKDNGFKKAGTDSGLVRYLKPMTDDFSYGALVGRTGKEDLTAVQFGVVNNPMWELQQDVEGTRDLEILFLLYTRNLSPVIEKNGHATYLEYEEVAELLQNEILHYENNLDAILEDIIKSLKEFKSPMYFYPESNLGIQGFAHYYGLLYKHLYIEPVSENEICEHINVLLEKGLSSSSVAIFCFNILKKYIAKL